MHVTYEISVVYSVLYNVDLSGVRKQVGGRVAQCQRVKYLNLFLRSKGHIAKEMDIKYHFVN